MVAPAVLFLRLMRKPEGKTNVRRATIKDADERLVKFAKLAKSFGKEDRITSQFRRNCRRSGFVAVFGAGLENDAILKVLNSPETTRILGAHRK